jgi:O-antigen/teichoic acid export membrane protein
VSGRAALFRGGIWTVASYGASLGLRFLSNVVVAHLLAPSAIGALFIVSTIRYGVELLTDVGVEQSIVHNEHGAEPGFLGTAWTVQAVRGLAISLLFLALSAPLAAFYAVDVRIMLFISVCPFINSLASVSIFVLVRQLRVRDRNLFELAAEALSFVVTVCLAMALRSVWALVYGAIAAVAIRAALSYCIVPRLHGFRFDRRYLHAILHFGKWVLLSSLLTYVASSADRIILGRYLPVATLGIFGIAKIIADIPATLAGRVSYQIMFPAAAAFRDGQDQQSLDHLHHVRSRFLLLVALGLGVMTAFADLEIRLIYDPRYHAAGWMLFALLFGAWFAVPSGLTEATLLGMGQPHVTGYSNAVKFAVLVTVLPLALVGYGLPGAIVAIVAAEALRFLFLLSRSGSTRSHDLGMTALFLAIVALLCLARYGLGLGWPWAMAMARG